MDISKIQAGLKAPKGQLNKFGNYKYRNCEDIVEGLKPFLHMSGYHLIITDDIVVIGDRFYVKATAKLINQNEIIAEANGFAREPESRKGMDDSQVTGAASSYARKYALNGLLAIDDTKDADSDEYTSQAKSNQQESKDPAVAAKFDQCKSMDELLSLWKETKKKHLYAHEKNEAKGRLEKKEAKESLE